MCTCQENCYKYCKKDTTRDNLRPLWYHISTENCGFSVLYFSLMFSYRYSKFYITCNYAVGYQPLVHCSTSVLKLKTRRKHDCEVRLFLPLVSGEATVSVQPYQNLASVTSDCSFFPGFPPLSHSSSVPVYHFSHTISWLYTQARSQDFLKEGSNFTYIPSIYYKLHLKQ